MEKDLEAKKEYDLWIKFNQKMFQTHDPPPYMENAQVQPKPPQENAPFWLKHGIRLLGSVGSIIAIGLGAFACVTIFPTCILAGVMQMVVGLFVVLVEAPCLCPFLDFAQVPGRFFDGRPYWNRAIIYVVVSVIPLIICPGISTFFGSGLIFITGALYGVMALGRKADQGEMRTRAASMSILLPGQEELQQQAVKQATNYAVHQAQAEVGMIGKT